MSNTYGNHLGIVVQNNDPKQRGRVKVFVPYLSMNLYEGWDKVNADKSFNDLSDPYIKEILDSVKNNLPWANCASPIIGEVGNSYFDAHKATTQSGDGEDRVSGKPADDISANDKYGKTYSPEGYSNASKGVFSVPKVGSRVWVFFEKGEINRPVYFATSYDQSDWSGIADDNYPDKAENFSKQDKGDTDSTYKNKMVVSQRGGVIEIINTDNEEKISITQYNGSFMVMENNETNEFNVGNANKLTQGTSNETIEEDRNDYVVGNADEVVMQNLDLYVGGNVNVNIIGNADVNIGGNSNINVVGDSKITSATKITITAPVVAINP
jgi:hypothetical protein